jgi:hypothetical protein
VGVEGIRYFRLIQTSSSSHRTRPSHCEARRASPLASPLDSPKRTDAHPEPALEICSQITIGAHRHGVPHDADELGVNHAGDEELDRPVVEIHCHVPVRQLDVAVLNLSRSEKAGVMQLNIGCETSCGTCRIILGHGTLGRDPCDPVRQFLLLLLVAHRRGRSQLASLQHIADGRGGRTLRRSGAD